MFFYYTGLIIAICVILILNKYRLTQEREIGRLNAVNLGLIRSRGLAVDSYEIVLGRYLKLKGKQNNQQS